MIHGHFEGSLTKKQALHGTGKEFTKGGRSPVTMGMLPDVALLEIFDFYVHGALAEAWCTLVHVCRKWRNVAFGSPSRLNLRFHCGTTTPVRKTLDVWPLLPIVVMAYFQETWDMYNIIAALEHNHRICELGFFYFPSSQFEIFLPTMWQPFPALTYLHLRPKDEKVLVVPASFLGGTASRLRTPRLHSITFPGLPKLLLSATRLVDLDLRGIPHSGYISPEVMVTCLSALTRLESLVITFEYPRCRPDQQSRRPPPLTCTLLPALTELRFKVVAEYSEDLVARIGAPLLDKLDITYLHQLIFDTPRPEHTNVIGHIPAPVPELHACEIQIRIQNKAKTCLWIKMKMLSA